MIQIHGHLVAVSTMSEQEKQKQPELKERPIYKRPNITEANEKDWEDFFSAQEEDVFDR